MAEEIKNVVDATQNNAGKTAEDGAETSATKDWEAEYKKLVAENEKLKKANTNASKDASEWKAKFRETQDEATRAKEERDEELARILEENKTLKHAQTLATHKAGWLSLGFNEDIAAAAAEASVGGDFAGLIDAVKKFLMAHDKELNAANIRSMPAPVSGNVNQGITQEQFDNMSYREREKLFSEQPDVYNKLSGKQ